jgi:hypothetical protein
MGIHQAMMMGYATAEANPTWTLVDSEFKQSVGANFSVDNVQTGDFIYWTQAGDNAGSIATLTGWSNTFSDTDNTPAFKEQYRVATSNEGTVTVTSESDTEAGGLMVFRCSTGATSIDANAWVSTEGVSGDPVVPSANNGNVGTAEAYSLCIVNGYLDDEDISTASCTGLTVAGVAGGSRSGGFFQTYRSSLMVGYAVIPNAGTTAPAGAGNTWSTSGSDQWNSTAWYIRPS